MTKGKEVLGSILECNPVGKRVAHKFTESSVRFDICGDCEYCYECCHYWDICHFVNAEDYSSPLYYMVSLFSDVYSLEEYNELAETYGWVRLKEYQGECTDLRTGLVTRSDRDRIYEEIIEDEEDN